MKKVSKILIVCLAMMLSVEVFLRIFAGEQLKTRTHPEFYRPDSLIGFAYISNCTTSVNSPSRSNIVITNNHGFRGKDFEFEKDQDVFRIALVGASNEVGVGLDIADIYPSLIDSLLKNEGIRAEVINLSIEGAAYNFQKYLFVKSIVPKYNPDLVLFLHFPTFWNTYVERDMYRGIRIIYAPHHLRTKRIAKHVVDKTFEKSVLLQIYDYSYIVRQICKWYIYKPKNKNRPSFDYKVLATHIENKQGYASPHMLPYTQFSTSKRTSLVKQLVDSYSQRGIRLVMYKYFKERGSTDEILDYLYLDLSKFSRDQIHFKHDGHFSKNGHSIIAMELFNEIVANNMIPNVYYD